MQPTTITTLLMIAFALGLLTVTIRLYFGNWDARDTRHAPGEGYEPDIEAAVLEMRQQIEDYEQRHRRF